jgi:hypothetical protein
LKGHYFTHWNNEKPEISFINIRFLISLCSLCALWFKNPVVDFDHVMYLALFMGNGSIRFGSAIFWLLAFVEFLF